MGRSYKEICKLFIPPIATLLFKKIKFYIMEREREREREKVYRIQDREIILPCDHRLDIYQSVYNRYDMFLPHLAKFINEGFIIDIGANVGDTLYGMIQDNNTKFICIEPEPRFFSFLQKNIQRLGNRLEANIFAFHVAISSKKEKLSFSAQHGTASQIDSIQGAIPAKSLDDMAEEIPQLPEQCRLIKIDTDGFDYDCILSGKKFFSKTSALVFWENDFVNKDSLKNYSEAVNLLIRCGYKKFYIFDNYGNFMVSTLGNDILYFLNYYQESLTIGGYNNIPYYDILACQENDIQLIDNVIDKYNLIQKNKR